MKHMLIMDEVEINKLLSKVDAILNALTDEKNASGISDQWLNQAEAQSILQVSSRSLQNYRNQGILSFSKAGGKIRYKRVDVESLLQTNYVKGFAQW